LTEKQPTQLPTHFAFARSAVTVFTAVIASWVKLEAGSSPHLTTLAIVAPVDRAVWVGYFHVWETTSDGRSVRRKKEKTLGPATKAKHEALKELGEYIAEYTGEAPKQGEFISSFGELWQTFCAVQSGQWSKKTKENLQCLFKKHVVPIIGQQAPREVTLTSLQLLLKPNRREIWYKIGAKLGELFSQLLR
jgi:hypothetical protein